MIGNVSMCCVVLASLEARVKERLQGVKDLEPEGMRGGRAVGCDNKRQPFYKCMLVTVSWSILSYHLAAGLLCDRN